MTADPRFAEYRRTRCRRVRDALVEAHLPLARALARRYAGRGVEGDDLLQVACLGLIKAVDRFDPGRATSFTSFAVPTITGEIKRHFRDNSWSVHVPRRVRDLDVQVRAVSARLLQQLGRQPQLEEIATELGADVEAVIDTVAARSSNRSVALERLMADPTGALDRELERLDETDLVSRALERVDDRTRRLLELRFQDELTQRQIADRMGVSQVQVSRLLARSLATLRAECV